MPQKFRVKLIGRRRAFLACMCAATLVLVNAAGAEPPRIAYTSIARQAYLKSQPDWVSQRIHRCAL